MSRSLPRIALITAGGTIGMRRDPESGALVPANDGDALACGVPELARVARVSHTPLFDLDSSNLQPRHWVALARAVHDALAGGESEGVVVTHGTDTMAYTAAALSLMVRRLPGPVVLTGSQAPFHEVGSDGRRNLLDAFRVAAGADLGEVVLVFNGRVIRGSRAKKIRPMDYDTFASVGMPLVGTVEAHIELAPHARPRGAGPPLLDTRLDEGVCLLKAYPGMRPSLLPTAARGHRGMVLEGFGAGNVPTEERSLVPAIRECVSGGCHVVLTTQCVFGAAWSDIYKTGRLALEAGAIPAFDMNSEAALVKLMWVLGRTHDGARVRAMMHRDYAGEVTGRTASAHPQRGPSASRG